MIYASIIIFWVYLIYSSYKSGVPDCLSDTYYSLGKLGFLFPIFILTMVSLIAPEFLYKTDEQYSWIAYLMCIFTLGVATVPAILKKGLHIIHNTFAISASILMCVLWFLHGLYYIPILIILCGLRKNWLLGIEISFFTLSWLYCLL